MHVGRRAAIGVREDVEAQAVLDVFSQSSPEVKNAKIDLSKTYTNKFVDQAQGTH